jgi:hypothetical protein
MTEARIVWANDADGVARHIMEVETGLLCHCTCPGCNAKLEAVNSKNPNWKRRPHFRHYDASESGYCSQRAILAAARQMVQEVKEIKLPSFDVTRQVSSQAGKIFTGHANEPEQMVSVDAVEFVDSTDAVLTLAGGQKVLLRLIATTKRTIKPKQTVMGEIVINLADPVLQAADPEAMRQHITLADSARTWCHHYNEAKLMQQALEDAQQQLDTFVSRQSTIHAHPNTIQQPEFSPSNFQPTIRPPTRAVRTPTAKKVLRELQSSEYDWSNSDPAASTVDKIAHRYKTIWPRSDWRGILDFGISIRLGGEPVNAAIATANRQFRFSEVNMVIRDAWVAAGILRSKPKSPSQ